MKKVKLNTFVCACFAIVSTIYFVVALDLKYWSSQYAPGPGFIPRWVGGAMMVLSVIGFFQSFKEEGITMAEVLPKQKSCRVNLYVCWGGLVFFLMFVKTLGFVVTASILLAALFSRGTKWTRAIPASITVTLICFFIFKVLLQVQVPVNQFGW